MHCYVGASAAEEEDVPASERIRQLVATLEEQFAASAKLEKAVQVNLQRLVMDKVVDWS